MQDCAKERVYRGGEAAAIVSSGAPREVPRLATKFRLAPKQDTLLHRCIAKHASVVMSISACGTALCALFRANAGAAGAADEEVDGVPASISTRWRDAIQ